MRTVWRKFNLGAENKAPEVEVSVGVWGMFPKEKFQIERHRMLISALSGGIDDWC